MEPLGFWDRQRLIDDNEGVFYRAWLASFSEEELARLKACTGAGPDEEALKAYFLERVWPGLLPLSIIEI